MSISFYELDQKVFEHLQKKANTTKELDTWKGKASGIADYVSSWGIVRFWAMSRSLKEKGGNTSSDTQKESESSYFSWDVARKVLCQVVDADMGISEGMTTQDFQTKFFEEFTTEQQIIITELLLEIAETIQFWTMRFSDALEVNQSV